MTRRWKLLTLNLVDAATLALAGLASLALRFDGQIPRIYLDAFGQVAPFYIVAVLLLMNLSGVNRTLWRYAGVPTFLAITRTLFFAFFVVFLVNLIPQQQPFPKSVVILTWVLGTAAILGSRMAWKILRTQPGRRSKTGSRRVLIAGAGDVGATLAMEFQRRNEQDAVPIGFVDDDPAKQGRKVEHLPVLGTTIDIPRLIEDKRINEVLIAAPSAPAGLVRQIVSYCQEAGVTCRTVPSLTDYVHGKGPLGQVREVQIEDLLGRAPVAVDFAGISERIRGRTVLVTGAAGSIGSELCRQLARFGPSRLVAVDHAENRLTYLGLDLTEHHPELEVLYAVGDVKDEFGVDELMRTHKPAFVYHAAAHKHVNLLENAPREAILNNIMGTRNVARAAARNGVETFVLISTDKAVNPTNVMGASKRGCEMVLQSMAIDGKDRDTTFVAVRFGNVLGSEGSVLPIFRRQLSAGGPLTVTHPEARRYFMTIPEASQLVIQAGLLGSSGTVFVLDMGEQVRIVDVAEQLVRLSGLRPGIDIPIRFVGLRPGEKLEEELLSDSEQTRVTKHAKIFRWELDPVNPAETEAKVDRLISSAYHASVPELKTGLADLVPEYRQIEVAKLPEERVAVDLKELPSRRRSRARGPKREPRVKRFLDLAVSGGLLVLLAPIVGLLLLAYRTAGSGRVQFEREEKVGRNRRRSDRRRGAEEGIPIDRRDSDRRQRDLPGPIFVCYRIRSVGEPSEGQRKILARMQRYRLDRVLYLWNVLRGEMSLVGPSARLVDKASYTEDWTMAYIHSRRPGLIGPGKVFARKSEDRDLAELYDGYYGKFGGLGLDMETLMRSIPRLFRGESSLER
ncbi:MAG: SDR family NAD(P)-dependent oxidoreductase [Candidatus Eisenbacteria bacterium]|nr:SDR family NAD(P)-dependent oxidoreductase [Candidatus Eisenbacteria bacterium]